MQQKINILLQYCNTVPLFNHCSLPAKSRYAGPNTVNCLMAALCCACKHTRSSLCPCLQSFNTMSTKTTIRMILCRTTTKTGWRSHHYSFVLPLSQASSQNYLCPGCIKKAQPWFFLRTTPSLAPYWSYQTRGTFSLELSYWPPLAKSQWQTVRRDHFSYRTRSQS